MSKYILFDTETTGMKAVDRILQIGAMVINEDNKVEVYNELCSAPVPISEEAMSIHGIKPEDIENKVNFVETSFYNKLLTLNSTDNYLIAHNMPFDMNMLKKEGFKSNMKLVDTLRCARKLFLGLPSYALQELRYSLGLNKVEDTESAKYDISIKPHDAIGDVLVMKLLFDKLFDIAHAKYPNRNPIETLVEITNTPEHLKIFPYGRYKGQKISDIYKIDKGYIESMIQKSDLDIDIKYTLALLVENNYIT